MIDNTGFATTSTSGLQQGNQREPNLYDALVPQTQRARKTRGLAIRLAIVHALRRLADGLEANLPSAGPSRA